MFSRTFSSWGKLLGLGRSGPAGEEERRLWGRIPCDLETTCRSASGPTTGPLSARLRNISRGGLNLVLGRAFEPGTLLSVGLPGSDSGMEVLACVVHCEPTDDTTWGLGCTFAAPLADEDLEFFGAGVNKPATDQRDWVRYPCRARVAYQIVRSPEPMPAQPAEVLNISAGGVALSVAEPLEVGALLSVELSRDDAVLVTTLASVVRTGNGPDGGRLVGCNFIRSLPDDQIQAIL